MSLARDDFPPAPGDWDPITLLMIEVRRPATRRDPATASVAAVTVGAALRFARILRVAADELTVETMFGLEHGDDEPDFRFVVRGQGRESVAPALGCVRHAAGGVPMARLELGDVRCARAEVVAGLADLRELITAIEREAAGFTDGGML